jgi:hypothetical protein
MRFTVMGGTMANADGSVINFCHLLSIEQSENNFNNR